MIEAVVERHLASIAACLAPDVERIGPYGDVYRGREAYTAFLRDTVTGLSGYVLHVERLIVARRGVMVPHEATSQSRLRAASLRKGSGRVDAPGGGLVEVEGNSPF